MLLPNVFHLKILLEILTKKYFPHETCIMAITDPETEIPISGNVPKLSLTTGHSLRLNFLSMAKHHCQIFIIKSKILEVSLDTIEESMRVTNLTTRFNERKYILIPDGNWTQIKGLKYLSDVVLVQETDVGFELWMLDYGNGSLVFADWWFAKNGSFWFGSNLFPNKFLNQKGKVVRVCTIDIYNKDRNNIELRHLRSYFKKHNITEKMEVLPTGFWGEMYENRTATGMMSKIMNDETDIIVGFVYGEPVRWLYADFSQSTYRLEMTLLYPKPRELLGWYISQTFNSNVWILYYTTIAMLAIITTMKLKYDLKIGPNIFSVCFWIVAVFMQQYFKTIRNFTAKFKLLFAATAIYVMIFNTGFSTQLASLLVVPRFTDDINSLKDFEKSNLDWGNNHNGYIKPLKKIESYDKLTQRFQILNDSELNKRIVGGNFVFVLDRRMLYHLFTKVEEIKYLYQYKLMKTNLFESRCVIILRKNSVFLPTFNRFVERIQESGIAQYWEKRVDIRYHKIRKVIELSKIIEKSHEGLELQHLIDSFLILIIGYSAGFFVFLIEYLYNKYLQNYLNK